MKSNELLESVNNSLISIISICEALNDKNEEYYRLREKLYNICGLVKYKNNYVLKSFWKTKPVERILQNGFAKNIMRYEVILKSNNNRILEHVKSLSKIIRNIETELNNHKPPLPAFEYTSQKAELSLFEFMRMEALNIYNKKEKELNMTIKEIDYEIAVITTNIKTIRKTISSKIDDDNRSRLNEDLHDLELNLQEMIELRLQK